MNAAFKLAGVIVLSQFAFYLALYFFLRTQIGIWRFMLYGLPVFVLGVWGPLWSLRFARAQGWSLVSVQLGMFAAAILAAFLGVGLLARQVPGLRDWLGLALVVAGVVVSIWR